MNKFAHIFLLLSAVLLFNTACEKSKTETEDSNEYVNNWIYEQMAIYYYWNDNLPQNPDYALNPEKFFHSLLNTYSANNPDGDRFSQIQENYVDLSNSLGGITSDEIGFQYILLSVDPAAAIKHYYLLVLYPKLNTDAEKKGIKRGQFVIQINNQDITENNLNTLLSGTGSKTLTLANWVYNEATQEDELKIIPDPVTVQMHKDYAENPILLDTVFTVNNKKIGYLVYNFFAKDKGDQSYAYDIDLMNSLASIKSEGSEDFILDLRYNGGGDVTSAIALASALVKERSTENLLISVEFNPIVHNEYKNLYGEGFNKDYFIDRIMNNEQQVIAEVPALSLPRLYVLVSRLTASASELIINGLKPYMDVILIGETTVGKNVGSFLLYEENDPRNRWGILPITFKYFNSEGASDFTAGLVPDYPQSEFEDLMLADFGNFDDRFLYTALTLITGAAPKSSIRSSGKVGTGHHFKVVKNPASLRVNQLYDSRYSLKER